MYQSTRRNITEAQKTPLQITLTYFIGMSLWSKLNNVKHDVGPGLHIGLLILDSIVDWFTVSKHSANKHCWKGQKIYDHECEISFVCSRVILFLEWFSKRILRCNSIFLECFFLQSLTSYFSHVLIICFTYLIRGRAWFFHIFDKSLSSRTSGNLTVKKMY